MWYLVDNASSLYLLLGVAGVIIASIIWRTRQAKYFIPLGIILVLVGLVWLMTRLVVTDRLQIENNIRGLADAVLEQKPDRVASFLAQDFEYGGIKREEAAKGVVDTAHRHTVFNYKIW